MQSNPHFEQNLLKLEQRDLLRSAELDRIEREAIANFSGQLNELEAALGMLRLGDHFGWKVLILLHNKRTIRKYEEMLGINIREFFLPEGPSAERSTGYSFVKKIGNFWKAVSGEVKIEHRRELSEN